MILQEAVRLRWQGYLSVTGIRYPCLRYRDTLRRRKRNEGEEETRPGGPGSSAAAESALPPPVGRSFL